jgi:hypothetical protein
MSEEQDERIDRRTADNESVVHALREDFEPITRNLTPEIEPATVFLLR